MLLLCRLYAGRHRRLFRCVTPPSSSIPFLYIQRLLEWLCSRCTPHHTHTPFTLTPDPSALLHASSGLVCPSVCLSACLFAHATVTGAAFRSVLESNSQHSLRQPPSNHRHGSFCESFFYFLVPKPFRAFPPWFVPPVFFFFSTQTFPWALTASVSK